MELLNTLDQSEREEILLFASNSYFNHGRFKEQIIPFFKICLNLLKNKVDKKDIYSSLFPNQEFVEGKMEKLMADSHKILRKFLLSKYYFDDKNEFSQLLHFSEIARTRGLYDRHKQLILRLQRNNEKVLQNDFIHKFKQIELETSIHYVESLNNQKKGDLNIPNLLQTIEEFYHMRRIALINRYLLQQKIAPLQSPEIIKSNIENDYVPQNYIEKNPILKINYNVFNILKKENPNINDIQELSKLIIQHAEALNWENQQEFYTYLRNFCAMILMVEPDNIKVMNQLHDIYKENLSHGLLHYEGKITPSRYLAISENALKIKQFDWANNFIEKYKNEIYGENETNDIYRFNKALYLFSIGSHSDCLDFIPDTSPFYDYLLQGKRLEIKALYELKSDLLPFKLDAFKMFLSRNSSKFLSPVLRKKNNDFANLLHQITHSIYKDELRAEKLIKRIEEKRHAMEWHWLLEKAHALKGK